jgi:hypothetical protein
VQAARVNTVKVPKEMTLVQFNRLVSVVRYHSRSSRRSMGSMGATATLRAGQLAKQVVGGIK